MASHNKEVKPTPQLDKFKEAAREVETDDSEERFDGVLRRVAKAPPPPKENRHRSTK